VARFCKVLVPATPASPATGASGYHHHRGSLPLPLPARHERGEGWGEVHLPWNWRGYYNWNPLSLTLSPLLRREERESTSGMVVLKMRHLQPPKTRSVVKGALFRSHQNTCGTPSSSILTRSLSPFCRAISCNQRGGSSMCSKESLNVP